MIFHSQHEIEMLHRIPALDILGRRVGLNESGDKPRISPVMRRRVSQVVAVMVGNRLETPALKMATK